MDFNDRIILDEDPDKTVMQYDYKGRISAATSYNDIIEIFELLFPGTSYKYRRAMEVETELNALKPKALSIISILNDSSATPEAQFDAVSKFNSLIDFQSVGGITVEELRQLQTRRNELRPILPTKILDSYILTAQDLTVTLNSVKGKQAKYDKAYADINHMTAEIHEKYLPDQKELDVEVTRIAGFMDTWCQSWGYGNWQRVTIDAEKWKPWSPESVEAFIEEYKAGFAGFKREISVAKNSKPFLQAQAEEIAALPWEEMKTVRQELETAKVAAYDQVINTILAKSPVTEEMAAEWSKANVIYDKGAMAKSAKNGYNKKEIERDVMLFYRLTGGRISRIEFGTSGKSRSNAAHWSGVLNVGHGFGRGTLFHEMAHLLEDDEKIKAAAMAFRDRRRESPALYKLSELVPGSNYKGDEKAYKDNWIDPYVGKDYRDTATEVVSMGMQHLTSFPAMFALQEADPEHLAMILGLCASNPVIDEQAMQQKQAATQGKAAKANQQETFLKALDKQITKVGDFWSADGYVINTEKRYSYKSRKSVDRTEIRYNLKYDESGSLNSYNSYAVKNEKNAKRALFIWYKAGNPSGQGSGDLNLGNIVWQLESKRNKTLPEYILQTPLGAE